MLSYQMRRSPAGLPRVALIALAGTVALVGVLALLGLSIFSPASGSGAQGTARLPDAGALAGLTEQAKQAARALTSDPVLRQVDINPVSGSVFFHFTDAPATFAVEVFVPSPSASPDQWQVSRPAVSRLAGHARPGLELQALRIGPNGALRSLTAYWSGCAPRGLTLVGEREALTWHAFCTLADGPVATGAIDGRSGAFQPSPAPPAAPPR